MNLVLTKKELNRIKSSIQPQHADYSRVQRKNELKALSTEKMKNWPNTLEALRLKKESYLKDREAQEELKRQEIDREEAELRRQNRLESIRKANELLYAQTDKMKMLKSESLYADVIYTRQLQIADKKNRHDAERVGEDAYHLQVMDRVARLKAVEDGKIEQERQLVESIKVTRKVQLEQERKRKHEESDKLLKEGIAIKEKAAKALDDEIAEQARRRNQGAENNLRMLKANEELKLVKIEMERKEMEAAAAREAEIKVIDDRKLALKRMEAERFARQQETRQKLIDKAVEQLAAKSGSEQAILNKQITAQREKEDKASADKEARMQADWDATVASRTEQINRKRSEMQQQLAGDDEIALKWRRENEAAIRAEEDKVLNARLETMRIKEIQRQEGKERARKKQEDKLLEIEQAKFLAQLDGDDDAKFVELCKAEIERNVRLGKPVYTLLKALEYTAPQLQAAKRTQNIHAREREKEK